MGKVSLRDSPVRLSISDWLRVGQVYRSSVQRLKSCFPNDPNENARFLLICHALVVGLNKIQDCVTVIPFYASLFNLFLLIVCWNFPFISWNFFFLYPLYVYFSLLIFSVQWYDELWYSFITYCVYHKKIVIV